MTTTAPDMINHPPHYGAANGLEVIEVIARYRLDYWLGNVLKYLVRAGRKGCTATDLKMARFYAIDWMERYTANEITEPTADDDTLDWQTPESIADAFALAGDVREAVIAVLEVSVFSFEDCGPGDVIAAAVLYIDNAIEDLAAPPPAAANTDAPEAV